MIAQREGAERDDTWDRLGAPLDPSTIAWRQDGRPAMRDNKYFARFVCYVEAGTVRERLDAVVPGEWDLTLELLPAIPGALDDEEPACAFKARLQVLGVIREDVGLGRDYKAAATDAFKRAAVRFGIGHELYAMEQCWVQVDGEGKFAKPLEDPATVYARKHESGARVAAPARTPAGTEQTAAAAPSQPATVSQLDEPKWCPKCGGLMWDNRLSKKNPKAPDYKCRTRSCDGVIWPPKNAAAPRTGHFVDGPPPDDYDEALGF